MKAAELEQRMQEHHEYCVALGQSRTLDMLEEMARTMFPAGSLPDESEPVTFTRRELEILRNSLWQTKETAQRMTRALLDAQYRVD